MTWLEIWNRGSLRRCFWPNCICGVQKNHRNTDKTHFPGLILSIQLLRPTKISHTFISSAVPMKPTLKVPQMRWKWQNHDACWLWMLPVKACYMYCRCPYGLKFGKEDLQNFTNHKIFTSLHFNFLLMLE